MNSKVNDARKLLSSLTKKYCVKKYEKTISSSSSDEVSSDEVIKPVSFSKRHFTETVSPASSKHESARSVSGKETVDRIDKNSEIQLEKYSSVSESRSAVSGKSIVSAKSQLDEPEFSAESIPSSIKTDIQDIEHSDLEDDISEASNSSVVNVLANVYLISDDALEDVETIIGSDQSNIDEEGRSTRLSVGHSIKSIQLGSPLEPPKVESDDYESDFEDSNSESNTSADGIESEPELYEEQSSLKLNEYVLDESNDDTSHTKGKLSESDLKSVSIGNNVSIDVNEAEASIENYANIEEHTSSCQSSLNYSSSDSFIPDIKVKHRQQNKNTKISDSVRVNNNEVRSKVDIGVQTKLCSSSCCNIRARKSLNQDSIHSKVNSLKSVKINKDIGINVNLTEPLFKNIGVQTTLQKTFDSEDDENVFCRRTMKKVYINTSVKSTKYRPVVSASKFNNDFTNIKESVLSPPEFTKQGMTTDELISEILRSEIAMIKHFMGCHQRLYMECCQTIQSMNEDYKKSKICFISPVP